MSDRKTIADWFADKGADLARGDRDLLKAFIGLWRGPASAPARVPKTDLMAAWSEIEQKDVTQDRLRQIILKLNRAISQEGGRFRLSSRRDHVAGDVAKTSTAPKSLDEVADFIEDRSDDATKLPDNLVEPRGAPRDLLVFFSYAHLNEAQQAIQVAFFNELKAALSWPPEHYAHLPKIGIWRDEERMDSDEPGDPLMDNACERAFLGLLMMSDKYHHSEICRREARFFIDDDGKNAPGKHCVAVAMTLTPSEFPKRFTKGNRIAVAGDRGATWLKLWEKGDEVDRLAFVKKAANEIFKAAQKYVGAAAPEAAATKIEWHFENRPLFNDKEFAPAFASTRHAGRKAAAPAEVPGERVEIVAELLRWAREKSAHRARYVALLGPFGMGKTVTCQVFTQRLIEMRRRDRTLPLPVYFDLRGIDKIPQDGSATLEDLMDMMLRKSGDDAPKASEIVKYARERDAIVIFDGLDEVTNKMPHDAAIRLYREFIDLVKNEMWVEDANRRKRRRDAPRHRGMTRAPEDIMRGPRIVISCRTHYFRDMEEETSFLRDAERARLDGEWDIQRWFMLPFSHAQIEEWLTAQLGETDGRKAVDVIDKTYNLGELAQTPILLRFIREAFREIEEEALRGRAFNLATLYDILVNRTFNRDNPKHIIPVREKRYILQALALYLHRRGDNEIPQSKLDDWFQDYLEATPRLKADLDRAGKDAVYLREIFAQDLRNASLIVRPGADAFAFGHTSVREYFLADALYRACREGRAEEVWDVEPVSRETVEFMLQRHAVESGPERREFEAQFPRLMGVGRGRRVRGLAFTLWVKAWKAGGELPRPEVMDLSGQNFSTDILQHERDEYMPLQRTIWRDAAIAGWEFEHVDFSQADFGGVLGDGVRFIDCCFLQTKFESADIPDAVFRRCAMPEGALPEVLAEKVRAYECSIGGEILPPSPRPSRQRFAPPQDEGRAEAALAEIISKPPHQSPHAEEPPKAASRSTRAVSKEIAPAVAHALKTGGREWRPWGDMSQDASIWKLKSASGIFVATKLARTVNGNSVLVYERNNKYQIREVASGELLSEDLSSLYFIDAVDQAEVEGRHVQIIGRENGEIQIVDLGTSEEFRRFQRAAFPIIRY